MNWRTINLLLISLTLTVGCAMRPLRPGVGVIRSADGVIGVVQQSENPQTGSSTVHEKVTDGAKVTERTEVKIGAAQKDTAREVAAKLGSLKGVVWVGIVVFLFGVASLFYTPLKLIVGSSTTSVMASVAGLALIILPSMIVGNEVLILCIAAGAVGLYWWAHRYGKLRATVEHLKGQ